MRPNPAAAVIEMGGHDGERRGAGRAGQDVEEGDGIGTSGQADHDRLPGGRMPEAPQGLGDAGLESREPQREGVLLQGEKMVAVQGLEPRTPRI